MNGGGAPPGGAEGYSSTSPLMNGDGAPPGGGEGYCSASPPMNGDGCLPYGGRKGLINGVEGGSRWVPPPALSIIVT